MVREMYIRNRGRPKRTLDEVIQRDMVVKNLSSGMTRDRAKWRRVIHIANPIEWDKVYVVIILLLYFLLCPLCPQSELQSESRTKFIIPPSQSLWRREHD